MIFPWIFGGDNPAIVNCNSVDVAYNWPGYQPLFPSREWNLPMGTCKLMIVFAGSVRSGSTLNQQLAYRSLYHGLVGKHKSKDLQYWRDDRHKNRKADTTIQSILKQLKNNSTTSSPPEIVFTKSHQYDSEILRICDSNLVITVTRDPVDIISSTVGAGWLSRYDKNCTKHFERLDNVLANFQCWAKTANQTHQGYRQNYHLHFEYNEMRQNQETTSKAIVSEVAKIIGAKVQPGYKGQKITKEANNNIPGSHIKNYEYTLVNPCTSTQLRSKYSALVELTTSIATKKKTSYDLPALMAMELLLVAALLAMFWFQKHQRKAKRKPKGSRKEMYRTFLPTERVVEVLLLILLVATLVMIIMTLQQRLEEKLHL